VRTNWLDIVNCVATAVAAVAAGEDINNQIWAPFRFDPGTLGVTSNGRSAGITDFSLGDQWIFQLAKTPPPLWTRNLPPNWWESLGIESRLGILITCRRSTSDEGKQEWEILKTIDHVN